MQLLNKLIGIALMLGGIYILGDNILFTTTTSRYWWRAIPATGSVLCLLGGTLMLVLGRQGDRSLGWVLVGLGIALVFLSGGVVLLPTTLWTFFLSLILLAFGYKLFSR